MNVIRNQLRRFCLTGAIFGVLLMTCNSFAISIYGGVATLYQPMDGYGYSNPVFFRGTHELYGNNPTNDSNSHSVSIKGINGYRVDAGVQPVGTVTGGSSWYPNQGGTQHWITLNAAYGSLPSGQNTCWARTIHQLDGGSWEVDAFSAPNYIEVN